MGVIEKPVFHPQYIPYEVAVPKLSQVVKEVNVPIPHEIEDYATYAVPTLVEVPVEIPVEVPQLVAVDKRIPVTSHRGVPREVPFPVQLVHQTLKEIPVNVEVPVGQIEVNEVMVDTPYEVPNPVFVDVPVDYPVEVEGPPIIEHVVADPVIEHVVADPHFPPHHIGRISRPHQIAVEAGRLPIIDHVL